jgi:hypothetical protein
MIAFAVILLFPEISFAQTTWMGFVPCEGVECTACDLVKMANEIIKWLMGILMILFAFLMVKAGLGLVISGGNESALSAAKDSLKNALIGFVIVLAAWLIVDTLMRGLLPGGQGELRGFGPWSTVQCQVQARTWPGDPASDPAAPPLVGARGEVIAPVATCQGADCVPLSGYGVPCKNPNSCQISPDLAARLATFHARANIPGARVTEAMPPTRAHRSPCHRMGTCVDYSVPGGMSPEQIIRAIHAARESGLRPVYEVMSEPHRQQLIAAGVPADSVKNLGNWISAPHFSIYGQ